jgi:hypothetical protein
MAIKLEDIEIFSNSLGNNFGGGGFFGGASSGGGTNLTGIPNADYLQNLANLLQQQQQQQQQGPQLGPDDFGSYTIPVSDPTYRSGFDYARSIAGGIPMSQVIAPGVSYSPEQPMGYTQEQLNRPKDMPAPPPPPRSIDRRGDDVDFLGTGIGGVNIPVDRKQDFPPLSNLLNIGKLFGGGFDQEAIDKIVQERIAESMPTFEQPDLSQFVTKQDIPSFIPDIPTGREFSIDRDELIKDIRAGIDIPKYEAPDLSQFVRQEDIPSLIPNIPTGREFSIEDIQQDLNLPDFSQFVRQEDIPAPNVFDEEALRKELMEDIRGSINIPQMPDLSGLARLEDIPQYQAPDLSGFARLEDIPTMPTFDQEALRKELMEDMRGSINIPDISGLARLEDIPSFDPNVLKQDILMSIPQQQIPDVSKFVTQDDISKAIAGIDMPTYQAPDLSAYDTRLAQLEEQLAGFKQPTGGRFSVDQQLPMGLF